MFRNLSMANSGRLEPEKMMPVLDKALKNTGHDKY